MDSLEHAIAIMIVTYAVVNFLNLYLNILFNVKKDTNHKLWFKVLSQSEHTHINTTKIKK